MSETWFEISKISAEGVRGLKDIYETKFNIIVTPSGNVESVDHYTGTSVRTFLDTLTLQAMRDYERVDKKIGERIGRCHCTPADLNAVQRYHAGKGPQWGVQLSNRARALIKMQEETYEECLYHLNLLLLISPHTFCQPPRELTEQYVAHVLNYVTSPANYGDPSGGWRRTAPLTIAREGALRADVMGYIHTEKPRFKLKLVAKNRKGELEDKLDLEQLFHNHEFVGIVHYHVEKPYTFRVLENAELIEKTESHLTRLELSRNPDNKAIIIDCGSGKKRTHTDEIGNTFVAGTFDYWKEHPEVVGGPLARQLAHALRTDDRVAALQQN